MTDLELQMWAKLSPNERVKLMAKQIKMGQRVWIHHKDGNVFPHLLYEAEIYLRLDNGNCRLLTDMAEIKAIAKQSVNDVSDIIQAFEESDDEL